MIDYTDTWKIDSIDRLLIEIGQKDDLIQLTIFPDYRYESEQSETLTIDQAIRLIDILHTAIEKIRERTNG